MIILMQKRMNNRARTFSERFANFWRTICGGYANSFLKSRCYIGISKK